MSVKIIMKFLVVCTVPFYYCWSIKYCLTPFQLSFSFMSRSILRYFKSKMILVEISIKWRRLSWIYWKNIVQIKRIIGLTLNIYLQVTLHPPHILIYMSGIYIRICSTFMICCAINSLVKSNIWGKSYLAFDKSGNLINYFW